MIDRSIPIVPPLISVSELAQFKEGEFISHTFAYQKNLKAGKIELLNQHYELVIPITVCGLVCYILIPESSDSLEIKVVFRGTKDFASLMRDLEAGAAGAISFEQSKQSILIAINDAIKKLIENRKEISSKAITITFYGHSLGGADAQCSFVALMEKVNACIADPDEKLVEIEKCFFQHVKAMNLMAYNAAGITHVVARKASFLAPQLARKQIKLNLFWQHAAGDIVQQTGQASILSEISPDIASVSVLKVYYDSAPEKMWQSTYNLFQAGYALYYALLAHTHHCHKQNAPISRQEYYTNKEEVSRSKIQSMFSRKISLLQYQVVHWLQYGFQYVADFFLGQRVSPQMEHHLEEPFQWIDSDDAKMIFPEEKRRLSALVDQKHFLTPVLSRDVVSRMSSHVITIQLNELMEHLMRQKLAFSRKGLLSANREGMLHPLVTRSGSGRATVFDALSFLTITALFQSQIRSVGKRPSLVSITIENDGSRQIRLAVMMPLLVSDSKELVKLQSLLRLSCVSDRGPREKKRGVSSPLLISEDKDDKAPLPLEPQRLDDKEEPVLSLGSQRLDDKKELPRRSSPSAMPKSGGGGRPRSHSVPVVLPVTNKAASGSRDENKQYPASHPGLITRGWKTLLGCMLLGGLVAVSIGLAIGTFGISILVGFGLIGVFGGAALNKIATALINKSQSYCSDAIKNTPSVICSPNAVQKSRGNNSGAPRLTRSNSHTGILSELGGRGSVLTAHSHSTVAAVPGQKTSLGRSSCQSEAIDIDDGLETDTETGVDHSVVTVIPASSRAAMPFPG